MRNPYPINPESSRDSVPNFRGLAAAKYGVLKERSAELEGRPEVLPFSVADMEFPVAEVIRERLRERIDSGFLGYTFMSDSYVEAVTTWHRERHGLDFGRKNLAQVAGVVRGISVALRAFTETGDGVIIMTPVYSPFYSVIRNNQRVIRESPLLEVAGKRPTYHIDFTQLEELAAEETTTALLLCSPHNPAGRVWSRAELEQIDRICQANDVFVISDEIHGDLTYIEGGYTPYMTVSDHAWQNSLTLTAPSKTFSIAGLASSNAIADVPVIEQYSERLGLESAGGINVMGQEACEAAYSLGGHWLDETLDYIKANDTRVCEWLARELPAVRPFELEGTYLLWLDCRDLTDGETLQSICEASFFDVQDGSHFGAAGTGFRRVNIAAPWPALGAALDRFKACLFNLQ